MSVYCTGSDSPSNNPDHPPNTVPCDYQLSRSRQCAKDYMQGYKDYLQVDGYQAYDQIETTVLGCFAHARRKFIEAEQLQVEGKTGKADWAIIHIRKLYRIETEIKDMSPQERLATRQQKVKPLLQQFKTWLDKSARQVLPKSAVGKATVYSLGQRHKLERNLEDGNLKIDNNRAERAITLSQLALFFEGRFDGAPDL